MRKTPLPRPPHSLLVVMGFWRQGGVGEGLWSDDGMSVGMRARSVNDGGKGGGMGRSGGMKVKIEDER